MKDSLRLSLAEMAQIHYNQGYLEEALMTWQQSFETCTAGEDQTAIAFQICKASFEGWKANRLQQFI